MSDDSTADSPLDNPVWAALNGPARHQGEHVDSGVARYHPDINIWWSIDVPGTEPLGETGWQRLRRAAPDDSFVIMMRTNVGPVPEELWKSVANRTLYQLVLDQAVSTDDLAQRFPLGVEGELVELGAADVPEMLALTKLTDPGPFESRTHELGRYLGVRRGGELVAMAGERMQLEDHTEISAVCTHPDATGQGLAARLTMEIAAGIRSRGKTPFLHSDHENHRAIRLYEHLGFERRTESRVEVVVPASPTS